MLNAIEEKAKGQPLQPQRTDFPEICSRIKCPFPDCEYYETGENEGKPCRFSSGWRTTPQETAKNPLAPKEFHEALEEAIKRATKPFDERLKKIENQAYQRGLENFEVDGEEIQKRLKWQGRAEGLNTIHSD